jgi:hypothetical protein
LSFLGRRNRVDAARVYQGIVERNYLACCDEHILAKQLHAAIDGQGVAN